MDLPNRFESHSPLRDRSTRFECWKDKAAPVLRNQTLAALEITDVLMLDFSESAPLTESLATTLSYAMRQAGARMLELDSRELGALVIPAGPRGASFAPVLFDGTPGGAGHTLELLKRCPELLNTSLDVLYIDDEHHRHCDTCCTDCILSFASQQAAITGLLQRRNAYDLLSRLLTGAVVVHPDESAQEPAGAQHSGAGDQRRLDRLLARRRH